MQTNMFVSFLVSLTFIVFLVPVIFLPLNLCVNYKKNNSAIIWVEPLQLMENFIYCFYILLAVFLVTRVRNRDQQS